MFRNSLACFYEWKFRVEMYEMLENNVKIEKGKKKDFVFFQLNLVWPNDRDASYVYQFLSFFFQNMNLWSDFLHFIFVSLESTSLLQILKLVIGNVRILCIALLNMLTEFLCIFNCFLRNLISGFYLLKCILDIV